MHPSTLLVVRHIVPCFETPWAWRMPRTLCFEHASGVVVELETRRESLSQHSIAQVYWQGFEEALSLNMAFEKPHIVQRPKRLLLGSLRLPKAGSALCLESFQTLLHQQWGYGCWKRLRAVSHVLAERWAIEGGEWVCEDTGDALYKADGFPHARSWENSDITLFVQAHHLCRLDDSGQFLRVQSMELEPLSSGHERLNMATEIAWAQTLFS